MGEKVSHPLRSLCLSQSTCVFLPILVLVAGSASMAGNRQWEKLAAMGSVTTSSSQAVDGAEGEWRTWTVASGQMDRLSALGYLPPSEVVSARPGLIAINDEFVQERCPNPQGNERVCFVPFLIRGLGFPIHPFLRGLPYLYRLQLQHVSPNTILHIACFITLCEAFLGCQPHIDLWHRYFCVQLRIQVHSLLECHGVSSVERLDPATSTVLPRIWMRTGRKNGFTFSTRH